MADADWRVTEDHPGTSGERDDGEVPATAFGLKLGIPLAVLAVAWAFVGPARILEVGRYEWPLLVSFVEPIRPVFFAYVATLVFAVALLGSMMVPALRDVDREDYATDFSVALLFPTSGTIVLMVVLGYLVPAIDYVLGGAFAEAGFIVVGIGFVGLLAVLHRNITLLVLVLASLPLWLPALVGAYSGFVLQDLAN